MAGELGGVYFGAYSHAQTTSGISSAGGIASAEAVPSPSVATDYSITTAGGIASAEAVPAPAASTDYPVAGAGGIASSEAVAAPSAMPTISDAGGVPSAEAVGVPAAAQPTSPQLRGALYYGGAYFGEYGMLVQAGALTVAGGIASSEVVPAPVAAFAVALGAAGGVASGEGVGAPSLAPQISARLLGLPYYGGVYYGGGAASVLVGAITGAGGIASAEAVPAPTLTGTLPTISGAGGIDSQEFVPAPRVGALSVLFSAAGYYGGAYFGQYGSAYVTQALLGAGGIPSAEVVPAPAVLFAQIIGAAGGIPSAEAVGIPSLLIGIVHSYDPSYRRRPRGVGCGDYEAFVTPRGSGERLVELPLAAVTWGREIDQRAQLVATLAGVTSRCRLDLAGVEPWAHEVALYRSGTRIWRGPVYTVSLHPDQSILTAITPMGWLEVLDLLADHDYPANPDGTGTTDLAVIWNAIVSDAWAQVPELGGTPAATTTGILGSYESLGSEHRNAQAELDSISRTGVDWTEIDGVVLAGGAALPQAPFAYITDEDLAEIPPVVRDGSVAGIRQAVRGAGSGAGADPIFAAYGPQDATYAALRARYGPVTRTTTDDAITDTTSALASAKTRWAAYARPPLVVTDAILSPSSPLQINDLVAGRIFDLRLAQTAVPITTRYRLGSVKGQATSAGEQISVAFQPLATDPLYGVGV